MSIRTKDLGLAAYIKLSNDLVDKIDGYYVFDSEDSIESWELKYYNSCCAKHDAAVMNLRRMKGKSVV